MLSPKMQRAIRVNETHWIMLSERAQYDNSMAGYLQKRSRDSSKWQQRWFVLYQNLLFYYETEGNVRPIGVVPLEGSFCERLITKTKEGSEQFNFAISYRRENQRQYELRAFSESDCKNWIEAIRDASFNKLLGYKEELEQKHLHLLQLLETERTAKMQYIRQCEEFASEVKKLRAEIIHLKKEWTPCSQSRRASLTCQDNSECGSALCRMEEDSAELRKIKKVQSFFRGWLCRRRWKQIVEQYIKSPHADSMKKRNCVIFKMVENEIEYTDQMETLVSCFLRPFKMAASSKKPPCTHDDVNSVFLNSETILFLHQIFLKGLTSRLENWPTLVLGDLFSILLPTLDIYQEYVRNHHYSLQILTECKQRQAFATILDRLETKPACQGLSLVQFLTFPMRQIPRYILSLHELLALTPHDHVERKYLESAKKKLETLSRRMHQEVSETENLRKNLAIERMIVEGCDILLDVSQVFVRQGTLIQLPTPKTKSSRKLSFKSEKEAVRQCFLFSNHLIIATRASNGKLHLVPEIGKIPLTHATLDEEPGESSEEEDSSAASVSSQSLPISTPSSGAGSATASEASLSIANRDFKIYFDTSSSSQRGKVEIHLVATSTQEKAAWISDISECITNVQFNNFLRPSNDISVLPQNLRNNYRLSFQDEPTIIYSDARKSCKVPLIRYATPEKLLQHLIDIRFQSVEFLNTFLCMYRVFTDPITVLDALKMVYYNGASEINTSPMEEKSHKDDTTSLHAFDDKRRSSFSPRRISGASSVSGYGSEQSERDRSHSYDSLGHRHWRHLIPPDEQNDEEAEDVNGADADVAKVPLPPPSTTTEISIKVTDAQTAQADSGHLAIPKVTASSSSETLTEINVLSAPCSPSNISSCTLVASSSSEQNVTQGTQTSPIHSPLSEAAASQSEQRRPYFGGKHHFEVKLERGISVDDPSFDLLTEAVLLSHRSSCTSSRSSISTGAASAYYGWKKSMQDGEPSTSAQRPSFPNIHHESPQRQFSRSGVVITSSRQSVRRTSTSTALTSFALAVAASSNPQDDRVEDNEQKQKQLSSACTMRVLHVLRHWISKFPEDFDNNKELKESTVQFLDELANIKSLIPAERKAASKVLKLLTKEEPGPPVDIIALVNAPPKKIDDNIETLSALEIAEQLTFIDHQLFVKIACEEFLDMAWMKPDKTVRAPFITMVTNRFNDVSRIVAREILHRPNVAARASAIEKWAAVADISRCLHNFNGVLQICSALQNSAIFRLKKTWAKVSKSTEMTLQKLYKITSTDGRFRALRNALYTCDPPCIPYLGMYLTDLSFIEEGTPDFNPDGLLNFAKMRMIANVIREIRLFQQTPYKIELIRRVADYVLNTADLMDDEAMFNLSLQIEPKVPRLSTGSRQQSMTKS